MKRLLPIILAFILFAGGNAWAASGCTVTSETVEHYSDQQGSHTVIKVTVVQTGTTFSFDNSDFSNNEEKRYWLGYVYWIGIDPTGTLDAAPQLTVTDKWSFTQFSDTSSFHVSNPIKVRGNSYDGQYLQLTDGQTWSFNDVGSAETIVMYIDIVR